MQNINVMQKLFFCDWKVHVSMILEKKDLNILNDDGLL
jgi:hypothetical protein